MVNFVINFIIMHTHRQNILNSNSRTKSRDVTWEYGLGERLTSNQKVLKSKGKSQKNILIVKHKKLPEFFKIPSKSKTKQNKNNSRCQKIDVSSQKLMKSVLKTQEQLSQENGKQQTFQNTKDDIFKFQLQNELRKQSAFGSDRAEYALQIKQRLKKSQSMKNLIQQRFLAQKLQKQHSSYHQQNNIYTSKHRFQTNTNHYDSTKYDWRLSKSKQKQKSLSSRSNKVLPFPIKKLHINKLTLKTSSIYEDVTQSTKKEKQQLFRSENLNDNVRILLMKHEENKKKDELKLSYTFGSGVLNSLNFD